MALGDPAHPAKNRNRALYDSIRKRFEPIQQQALVVDTTLGFDRQLHAILAFLDPGEQAPSLTGWKPTDILP